MSWQKLLAVHVGYCRVLDKEHSCVLVVSEVKGGTGCVCSAVELHLQCCYLPRPHICCTLPSRRIGLSTLSHVHVQFVYIHVFNCNPRVNPDMGLSYSSKCASHKGPDMFSLWLSSSSYRSQLIVHEKHTAVNRSPQWHWMG